MYGDPRTILSIRCTGCNLGRTTGFTFSSSFTWTLYGPVCNECGSPGEPIFCDCDDCSRYRVRA